MQTRPYRKTDKEQLNQIAIDAFAQYQDEYTDWHAIKKIVENMADLEESAEIIVAEESGIIIGGVAFVPPSSRLNKHFDRSLASIRILVVSPNQRGRGIGKELTIECINRAKSLGVNAIGLYTSPIMEVALSMYLRIGFKKIQDIEPICGVEYSIYSLQL